MAQKVPAELKDETYILVAFSYNLDVLFPYDDGIQLMSLFKGAIEISKEYKQTTKLTELTDYPAFRIISANSIRSNLAKELLEGESE